VRRKWLVRRGRGKAVGAEEAWRTEITRRAKELDSGAVQSIPWDLVKQRLARAPRG
jgi:putative addiction module component (TIGR02574 family)